MTDVLDFIQHQILGMRWLNDMVCTLFTALGLDVGTRIGGSIVFFIYDLTKIVVLLVILIFVISYIQSYYPPERTWAILSKMKGAKANAAGALLGTVTPFCSCSSIPIFIGFTKAGLPLGVTFSFLISSPLVDLAALTILMGLFGAEVAVLYVVVGVVVAIIGGMIIERMGMEDQIAEFARPISANDTKQSSCGCCCSCSGRGWSDMTVRERSSDAFYQVRVTLKRVFPYAVIGVLIGALIHNWIPDDMIQMVLGDDNPFSVIIATIVGAPIYADIFGTIPIAEALFSKGVGIGTILAFMMSVTLLSIPSLVMLKTAVKGRLLSLFVTICLVGVILTGYIFNLIF